MILSHTIYAAKRTSMTLIRLHGYDNQFFYLLFTYDINPFYFIKNSQFNAYQMWVKLVFFYSEKILYHSLVADTIYNFTVAKQGFLGNFGTGTFFKRFKLKDICQK